MSSQGGVHSHLFMNSQALFAPWTWRVTNDDPTENERGEWVSKPTGKPEEGKLWREWDRWPWVPGGEEFVSTWGSKAKETELSFTVGKNNS